MYDRMLFECVGGVVLPTLPDNPDGTPRDVDNVRFLDSVTAAARWGVDEATAREIFGLYLNDVMGASSPGVRAASNALREKYRHLSEEHFHQVLQRCRRLRFDPGGRHVWATTQWNQWTDSMEPVIQLSADGFHAVALRTGELLKLIGPEWCGEDLKWVEVWLSDGNPLAARVSVLRRGMEAPITMVARWQDYAPEPLGFWAQMPSFMLGKCAACAAVRRAFADHLDGVYGAEEMARSRVTPSESMRIVSDDSPQTNRQFELSLIDLGIGKPSRRQELIEEFRQRFRPLYTQNLLGWYAAVLSEVRRRPEAYGITAELQGA